MRVQYAIITRHRFEDPQELAIIVRVTFLQVPHAFYGIGTGIYSQRPHPVMGLPIPFDANYIYKTNVHVNL